MRCGEERVAHNGKYNGGGESHGIWGILICISSSKILPIVSRTHSYDSTRELVLAERLFEVRGDYFL